MEADRTVFERIDAAVRPNESGDSSRNSSGNGPVVARKLSCDGIWAEWATAGTQRSGTAARRFAFSVGAGRRPGAGGKLGAALLAATVPER